MDGVRWKHKKTGNLYQIVSYVIIEKTLTPAVCYEPVSEPNAMFVRPCVEFFDGRFQMIESTADTDRRTSTFDPAVPMSQAK